MALERYCNLSLTMSISCIRYKLQYVNVMLIEVLWINNDYPWEATVKGTVLFFLADTIGTNEIGGFKLGLTRSFRKCQQCSFK